MKNEEFESINKKKLSESQEIEKTEVNNISKVLVVLLIGIIAILAAFIFAALAVFGEFVSKVIGEFLLRINNLIINRKTTESKIMIPFRYKLLKLSEILFSAKTQKEVFLQSMADWDEEIYEAIEKNKDANLFMINTRNTYSFVSAMWMRSPIGDLIEFIQKLAK